MKNCLLFLLLLIALDVTAQGRYESYTWNTLPATGASDTIKSVNGTVVLMERRIKEIYLNKEKNFEEIQVRHRKIKVETNDAVDAENKIYIPLDGVIDILDIKARFISAGGKITNLKKENIRELENLENKGNYKTFAIEGAEAGGIIEYYYILRKNFEAYGTSYMQGVAPQGDVMVIFSFPSKLEYNLKSYNGFPDFVLASDDNETSVLRAHAGYIPSLQPESYGFYRANLMRYEFTLAYNHYNSLRRVYSWQKACNNCYSNVYTIRKDEMEAVKSWAKKLNLPKDNPEILLRAFENHVKSEITIQPGFGNGMDLEAVLKNKQADNLNILKLFIAFCESENIPFELVLTCDAEDRSFDPDFNGFNYLEDYIMYFPKMNLYTDPVDPDYRLGMIPSNYQGNYGLFMQPVAYDDNLKTLGYDIRLIPFATSRDNIDSLFQVITPDLENGKLMVKSRRVFYGDVARIFQSSWNLCSADRKEELVNTVFNMGVNNTKINSYTVKNSSPSDIGVKPFDWDVDITAGSLVETAGNDLIIKIGETIGAQSELYEASKRKLPIQIDVLRSYYRHIVLNIPAGYRITNPEDLDMRVEMTTGGKINCIFTSEARIQGGQLIITSTEYYADSSYPVDRYEEFRKVINAAADFNKKTLILQKE